MMKCYLTKDEFINAVFHELEERGLEPVFQDFMKFNLPCQKVLALTKYNPARIIYVERHYDDFLQGTSFTSIINEIITLSSEKELATDKLGNYPLNDWICMRMFLRSRVFSEVKNRKLIETNKYPCRKFLDLVETFFLQLEDEIIIPVDSNLMYLWGVDIDEVAHTAELNQSSHHYSLTHITDAMYMLTWKGFESYGATGITNLSLLKSIYSRFGNSNFYILPSSVHDLILLPANTVEPEEFHRLKQIVQEANDTVVDEVDRLSYSVYYFDSNEVKLII